MQHGHPLDADGVRDARETAMAPRDAELVSSRLGLLCEPTRLRMLQALERVGELCVGDAAVALGVSDDAASYALRQLRTAGLVDSRREGRVVFYGLSPSFPRMLLTDCLNALGEQTPPAAEEQPQKGGGQGG